MQLKIKTRGASSLTSLADAVNVHSQTSVVKLVVDLLSALIHALLGDTCREITRKELMKDVPLAAGLGDAHADATGHDTSGDRARDGGDDGHWSRAELWKRGQSRPDSVGLLEDVHTWRRAATATTEKVAELAETILTV